MPYYQAIWGKWVSMSETGAVVKPKLKLESKKRSNWPVVILLVITIGLSLVFYLKNVNWNSLNLNINFDWLDDLWGTGTVTFEK